VREPHGVVGHRQGVATAGVGDDPPSPECLVHRGAVEPVDEGGTRGDVAQLDEQLLRFHAVSLADSATERRSLSTGT
jgi:hypothetical protein